MTSEKNIKAAFERIVQAMERQPEMAKSSRLVKATIKDGLTCDIECGSWKMQTDMPKKAGGAGSAPTPGDYMGMAIAGCQLITTALWAAHDEIPLEKLEIEVLVDKDSRGLFGVHNNPPRWTNIRYRINIKSPADETKIHKLLDAAGKHSPMKDNMEYAFHIEREVNILK